MTADNRRRWRRAGGGRRWQGLRAGASRGVQPASVARVARGGMRWIEERAGAVLQLRCIEVNGDWEAFVARVHDDARARMLERGERVRRQQRQPEPLPHEREEAA